MILRHTALYVDCTHAVHGVLVHRLSLVTEHRASPFRSGSPGETLDQCFLLSDTHIILFIPLLTIFKQSVKHINTVVTGLTRTERGLTLT